MAGGQPRQRAELLRCGGGSGGSRLLSRREAPKLRIGCCPDPHSLLSCASSLVSRTASSPTLRCRPGALSIMSSDHVLTSGMRINGRWRAVQTWCLLTLLCRHPCGAHGGVADAPAIFRTCSDDFAARLGLMTGPVQFSGSGMAPPGAAAPALDLQNTNGALSSLLPSLLGAQGGASATILSHHAQAGTNQLAGLLQSLSGATGTLGAPALSGGGSLLAGQELASLGGANGRAGRGGGGRTSSDTRPVNSYNARHQQVRCFPKAAASSAVRQQAQMGWRILLPHAAAV